MKKITRALALAFALSLTTAGLAQAATAPARFVGKGTQFWEYTPGGPSDSGNGPLTVTVDTSAADGVAPGTANIIYTFSSGAQLFFENTGQVVAHGSWDTGWSFTQPGPDGTDVEVGPFGDGTNISFSLNGFSFNQILGTNQGPWISDGSFAVTQAF